MGYTWVPLPLWSGQSCVWTAWPEWPSVHQSEDKYKVRPWGVCTLSSYSWLSCRAGTFECIIFQPNWRVIKTEIACFTNGVTRELVSNFFGLPSSFYGENLSGSKKRVIEKETTLCSVYTNASSCESVRDALGTSVRDDLTVTTVRVLKNVLQYPLCILELCTAPGCSPGVSLQWACIAPQPACHYTILRWSQCILFICLWC